MTSPPARLMKPGEVADLFDVEISTVQEWARIGKLPAIKTPGGQHYRFRSTDVEAALAGADVPTEP